MSATILKLMFLLKDEDSTVQKAAVRVFMGNKYQGYKLLKLDTLKERRYFKGEKIENGSNFCQKITEAGTFFQTIPFK